MADPITGTFVDHFVGKWTHSQPNPPCDEPDSYFVNQPTDTSLTGELSGIDLVLGELSALILQDAVSGISSTSCVYMKLYELSGKVLALSAQINPYADLLGIEYTPSFYVPSSGNIVGHFTGINDSLTYIYNNISATLTGSYVPYLGANQNVDLGTNYLVANRFGAGIAPTHIVELYESTSDTDVGDYGLGHVNIDGISSADKGILYSQEGTPVFEDYLYRDENGEYLYRYSVPLGRDVMVTSHGGRIGVNHPSNYYDTHTQYIPFTTESLNDCYAISNNIGSINFLYEVMITAAGSQDAFMWRRSHDGGTTWSSWSSQIDCSITPVIIDNLTSVYFLSVTGHSLNDVWSFTSFAQLPQETFGISPAMFSYVLTTEDINNSSFWKDKTYPAATTRGDPFILLPIGYGGSTDSAAYFGMNLQFNSIWAHIDTPSEDLSLIVEYWNGTDWTALSDSNYLRDESHNLTTAGKISWLKSTISDWTTRLPEGITEPSFELYWIRLRSSSVITTAPKVNVLTPHGEKMFSIYAAQLDPIPSFFINPVGDVVLSEVISGNWNATPISWSKVNKSGSNLTDIETRSHTVLTDIGRRTHDQLDASIDSLSNFIPLSGSSSIYGSLIPTISGISLGTLAQPWKDVYVSSGSYYLGSTKLTIDTSGNLIIDNGIVTNVNLMLSAKLFTTDFQVYSGNINTTINALSAAITGENLFDRYGTTVTPHYTGDTLSISSLVINSSGLVTNLNADLLDGQHATFYATSSIVNTALNTKLDNSTFQSYSGLTNSALSNISGVVDSKLAKSDFQAYTGTNNSAISSLSSVITGKLDSSAFQGYSGVTNSAISNLSGVVDSKLNTSIFQSYSSNLNNSLSSKLNVSDFTSYSGATQTAIFTLSSTITGKLDSSIYAAASGAWQSSTSTVASNSSVWSSSTSVSYLSSVLTGKLDSSIFQAYSANTLNAFSTLSSTITGKLDTAIFQSYSANLNNSLSSKLDVTVYSSASGAWQSSTSTVASNSAAWTSGSTNKLDTSLFQEYSANTLNAFGTLSSTITGKLDNSAFQSYSGNLNNSLSSKLDVSIYSSASGAWQSSTSTVTSNSSTWNTVTNKLDSSLFQSYSANTLNAFSSLSSTITGNTSSFTSYSGITNSAIEALSSAITGKVENTTFINLTSELSSVVKGTTPTTAGHFASYSTSGGLLIQDSGYNAASFDTAGQAATLLAGHTSSYNHAYIPALDQYNALPGTSGTPSSTNKYVTDSDARMTNPRTPTQHASTHAITGSDPISLTPSSVGLSAVTNDAQVKRSEMGVAGGVPTLDLSGLIPTYQLPPQAIANVYTASGDIQMFALSAHQGDVCVRTDTYDLTGNPNGGKSWIANSNYTTTISGWTALQFAGGVTAFNGRIGNVSPLQGDYNFSQLGNIPTTIGGYGITDAASIDSLSSYVPYVGATTNVDLSASYLKADMIGAGIIPVDKFHLFGTDVNIDPYGYEKNNLRIDGLSAVDRGIIFAEGGAPVWQDYVYRDEGGEFIYRYNGLIDRDIFVQSMGGRVSFNAPGNFVNYHTRYYPYTIPSLDDCSAIGFHNLAFDILYEILIYDVGAQDRFVWRKSYTNGSTWATSYSSPINCDVADILFDGDIGCKFDLQSGHSINDRWQFIAFSQLPKSTFDISPQIFKEVNTTTDYTAPTPNWKDVTYNAANTQSPAITIVPIGDGNTTTGAGMIGRPIPFNSLFIDIQTPAVNCTLVVEYWNGSIWSELTSSNLLVDETASLTRSGKIFWEKSTMSDWVTRIPEGSADPEYDLYWIRLRSSTLLSVAPITTIITPHGDKTFSVYAAGLDGVPSFYIDHLGNVNLKSVLSGSWNGTPIVWSKVNKAGSNLTDIATRSHTSLTDIGSYSHDQIDSKLNSLSGTISGKLDTSIFQGFSGVTNSAISSLSSAITGKLETSIYANASGAWQSSTSTVASNSSTWQTVTNKLDSSVFQNYSGNTILAFNVLSGAITGKLDSSAFQSYTGNLVTTINNLSGAITGKLDSSAFQSYSGTNLTNINNLSAAITGNVASFGSFSATVVSAINYLSSAINALTGSSSPSGNYLPISTFQSYSASTFSAISALSSDVGPDNAYSEFVYNIDGSLSGINIYNNVAKNSLLEVKSFLYSNGALVSSIIYDRVWNKTTVKSISYNNGSIINILKVKS